MKGAPERRKGGYGVLDCGGPCMGRTYGPLIKSGRPFPLRFWKIVALILLHRIVFAGLLLVFILFPPLLK